MAVTGFESMLQGEGLVLFIIAMIIIGFWTLVWKGIGLWFSARKDDKVFFILMMILNTVGIIPILYLYFKTDFFKKKKFKKKKR